MSFNSNFRPARESAFSVVCTSDVTTRRNELSCFDSLAIARMFTAAPARASVTRASSPVLSATKTLNSFMPCPLKTCSSESARRLQKTCFRIFGICHHVERLDRGRIAGEEVDLVAFLREALPEELLRLRVDVVSVPEPFALAPQDLECLLVPDAFEGEFRADR